MPCQAIRMRQPRQDTFCFIPLGNSTRSEQASPIWDYGLCSTSVRTGFRPKNGLLSVAFRAGVRLYFALMELVQFSPAHAGCGRELG